MINKIFLSLIILFLGACATASMTSQPQAADILDQLQSIPLGSVPEDVKKAMGEPTQQAGDANTKEIVFRYSEKGSKDLHSRSHFVFRGVPPLLIVKYIQVYEFDPESQLKFWREKYPNQNLKIVSKSRCAKGVIKKYDFIDIDPNLRLELENGNVTRIYWHSQVEEVGSTCK